ncbi:MAG: TSUP family transporter [Lachnospirales bacterium]
MLVIIGICAGIISGMGIGGGTILIPALTLFMGMEQKTAQTINLIYFVPTAAMALISHIKNKRIEYKNVIILIITGIIGAFIGAYFAGSTKNETLRLYFGIFLTIMGISEVVKGIRYNKR